MEQLSKIAATLKCVDFKKKVEAIRGISGLLCKMIHHLESSKARTSWVVPLFDALVKDFIAWKNSFAARKYLTQKTMLDIETPINK